MQNSSTLVIPGEPVVPGQIGTAVAKAVTRRRKRKSATNDADDDADPAGSDTVAGMAGAVDVVTTGSSGGATGLDLNALLNAARVANAGAIIDDASAARGPGGACE